MRLFPFYTHTHRSSGGNRTTFLFKSHAVQFATICIVLTEITFQSTGTERIGTRSRRFKKKKLYWCNLNFWFYEHSAGLPIFTQLCAWGHSRPYACVQIHKKKKKKQTLHFMRPLDFLHNFCKVKGVVVSTNCVCV